MLVREAKADMPEDYAALPDAVKSWMKEHTLDAEGLVVSCRVKIITSIISMSLTTRSNPDFCFGISENKYIRAAAKLARPERKCPVAPRCGHLLISAIACKNPKTKQWVHLTRKLIAQCHGEALDLADSKLHYTLRYEIFQNLGSALPVDWTPGQQDELSKIIVSTVQLFRLLRKQAARLETTMVKAGIHHGNGLPFNAAAMEDIGTDMEDDEQGKVTAIAVLPAVLKWGNQHGEHVWVAPKLLCR